MAGNPVHGREGALYLSTSANSTGLGKKIGWINSWTWTPSKDNDEITPLDTNSKYYVEGLVSGSMSAEGSFIPGSSGQRILVSRFAKTQFSSFGSTDVAGSTDWDAITDGNIYFHCINKTIDTGGSSDDRLGQKYVVPALASGLSAGASGSGINAFSFDGQQNGDVIFVESGSTASGIPKKVY